MSISSRHSNDLEPRRRGQSRAPRASCCARPRSWAPRSPACRRISPSSACAMPTSCRWPKPTATGPVQAFLERHGARAQAVDPRRHAPSSRATRAARVANASLLIDADGKRVARYDKIHLFDVTIPGRNEQYLESTHVTPGRKRGGRGHPGRQARAVGVLRHALSGAVPGSGRAQGAEWLAMPAAFTVPTGRAHWETLLRARAIENLCYVVAPAQSGTHTSGRETYGDTLDRRLLGPGAVAPAEGHRRDHSAISIWRNRRRRGRAFRRSTTGGSACANVAAVPA